MIKKVLIAVLVLVVVLGIIFMLTLIPQTGVQPMNNTTPVVMETLVPAIKLDSIYWSFTGESTPNQNVCLNKSRNSMYEFTIIGSSNVSLSKLDGCYVKLNGNTTKYELRSITNEIKISAQALTHFESSAQLCCNYRNNSYCSQTTNITVCALNLTDIELPSVGKKCKIFSDCTGFCDTILNGFTPNNCGEPYSFCGSNDFCSCACRQVNYKL